ETLIVQSGKPVAIWPSHESAPRVLISNSMLVPAWANWETFRRLEAEGLTMYGQMTAGSWIYIGTQGILQGTFETFAALAQKHFGGSLRGHVTLTAGLRRMGGAPPRNAHCRARRHRRAPANCRHHERGRRNLRGGRSRANSPAHRRALLRRV